MPVTATLEAAAADPLRAVRQNLVETMKVIQGINDRLDRLQHRAHPDPPGIPD